MNDLLEENGIFYSHVKKNGLREFKLLTYKASEPKAYNGTIYILGDELSFLRLINFWNRVPYSCYKYIALGV